MKKTWVDFRFVRGTVNNFEGTWEFGVITEGEYQGMYYIVDQELDGDPWMSNDYRRWAVNIGTLLNNGSFLS
jgi:hypothetical protein